MGNSLYELKIHNIHICLSTQFVVHYVILCFWCECDRDFCPLNLLHWGMGWGWGVLKLQSLIYLLIFIVWRSICVMHWIWNLKALNVFFAILYSSSMTFFVYSINWFTQLYESVAWFTRFTLSLTTLASLALIPTHDDVIKARHFLCYWPSVRGIHRSQRFPLTQASDAVLWYFLWSAPEQTVE